MSLSSHVESPMSRPGSHACLLPASKQHNPSDTTRAQGRLRRGLGVGPTVPESVRPFNYCSSDPKLYPPRGVYSASLQASIYDAACLALTALPVVSTIKIDTPNKHYLPAKLLDNLGDRTGEEVMVWEDDVFIPRTSRAAQSSAPSGDRHRGGRAWGTTHITNT